VASEESKATYREYYQNNKEVILERQRIYRALNKEKVNAVSAAWKLKNKEYCLERSRSYNIVRRNDPTKIIDILFETIRSRAKYKGMSFNLEKEDIVLPTHCPILNKPFIYRDKKYTYSIDRKDSTKGYTKDNVWVVSLLANRMKSDATEEEVQLFGEWCNRDKEKLLEWLKPKGRKKKVRV
jgi:hypothetical protein